MRALLLAVSLTLSLAACGPECRTHCDCTRTDAPVKCPGEWLCSSAGSCEYACKDACTATSGCPGGTDSCLNGGCTSRQACR